MSFRGRHRLFEITRKQNQLQERSDPSLLTSIIAEKRRQTTGSDRPRPIDKIKDKIVIQCESVQNSSVEWEQNYRRVHYFRQNKGFGLRGTNSILGCSFLNSPAIFELEKQCSHNDPLSLIDSCNCRVSFLSCTSRDGSCLEAQGAHPSYIQTTI